MSERKSSGLKRQMLVKALVPMLVLTILITIMAFYAFSVAMEKEVRNELQYICDIFYADFDGAYPGDMTKEGTEEIRIYKGGVLINGKNELLDRMKELCGIDVTLFYNDLRVLTTITDRYGRRIAGTTANLKVDKDVIESGRITFYNNVTVNEEPYYGYYKPIYNADGTCTGMIFAGKEASSVRMNIMSSILPLVLVSIAGMLVAGIYTTRSSGHIINRIKALQRSLGNVSDGKLDGGIDIDILKQNDEISDIGRAVMHMQRALKELVEMDALTGINNRRSGESRLKDIINRSKIYRTPFSVAIGDIDFFKCVNDTYGHDAGDVVLERIASIMKNEMRTHGYVARWGGEEFLLVFDREEYEKCVDVVRSIHNKIKSERICVEDDVVVQVTMTFGITEGKCDEELRLMFNRADTLLYSGKNNGRNQVVTDQNGNKA